MTDTAYRGPPCEECRARAEEAKSMRPFVESRDRVCPECRSSSVTMWRKVCRGSGAFLVEPGKSGFWLFRWWGRKKAVTFECDSPASPRHFHLGCQACNHRWRMLTATESAPEADDSRAGNPFASGNSR